MNKYESGVNYMDTEMIDLKALIQHLKNKLIFILLATLVAALALNIYGVRKANRSLENAEKQHLAYSAAVGELPGYYTESLYNLRARLSNNAAEFAEAYANIYKSFLKEYNADKTEIETENLEAYMMFLDSYKDVISVMSGTQREYYELLISTDTDADPNSHPVAEPFEKPTVSPVQPASMLTDITAVNANVTVPAPYTVENIILVTEGEEETSKIAVDANFAENASIESETSNPIAVNNKNGEDNLPNLNIDAENATVTLNNKWNEVEASVSENTLIVNGFGHISKLVVNKGNVIVNVPRQSDIADVIDAYELAQGSSIDYLKKEVTNANIADLCSIGEMTLMENVARATSFVTLYLNRYSSSLEINGEGTLRCANNYGLWNNSAEGKIVINGGNVEAETHAVYAQTGVIEINGGSFKLTNADTADRDENGNLRFLINCLDANYQSGKANIIVKGGKFYEFDPANNASEGAGTNYVAAGYQSTMSMEDGKKVYTVTKL